MIGNWLKKARCPIGVDLGSHGVRLLQLDRVGSGWKVLAAAEQRLPGNLPEGEQARDEAYTQIIKKLTASGGFVGRRVVSCLPASSVQYKHLRVPNVTDEQLRASVESEAYQRLRLEEGVRLEYFDAGQVRQGEDLRREVILMTVPTGLLDRHVRVLTGADLKPVAVDVVPGALTRFVSMQTAGGGPDATRVLLDIGYSSSKVTICRAGRIAFFKLIDIGGRHLDEAVAGELGVTLDEAAQLRRGGGGDGCEPDADGDGFVEPDRQGLQQAVFDAVRENLSDLAREVSLCLRYYSVTFRGQRPQSAMLVGGVVDQRRQVDLLTKEVGITVEPLRDWGGIDPGACGTLTGSAGRWVVAAGLALRTEEHADQRSAA